MAQIILQEGIAPSAPTTGNLAVYAKSDGNLYIQNDLGVETPVTGSTITTNTIVMTASISLGGNRVGAVNSTSQLIYADNTIISLANAVIGITTAAFAAGVVATIQTNGIMTDPAWAWTPQLPMFLSTNGLLTQVAPVAPATFLLNLGIAISATSIIISIQAPIAVH